MNIDAQEARQVLRSAEEICSAGAVSAAVQRIARDVADRFRNRNPLVLVVMRGGLVFAGQLLPLLDFPLALDHVDVTRYGDATLGGKLQWKSAPAVPVRDRDILLVDDILDEGLTLAEIRRRLLDEGAASVAIAVFSEKATGRPKPVQADFVGVTLPNRYVFGFGMDYKGYWRNLPAVYAIPEK